MDAEDRIAHWVATLDLAGIPPAVRSAAETCLIDGVGVWMAGRATDVYARSSSLTGIPLGAAESAFLGGVAIHALDYDDTSYAGIVHGTAGVLPAVMAACDHRDGDGRLLLEAFVAGVEVLYAMGETVTDHLYQGGHWCTTTLGILGASCGAARALGLRAFETANALRLAANMPLGLRVSHGSTAKPYLNGVAARLGYEAAQAARAGITGTPGTLEGHFGFADVHNAGIWSGDRLTRLGDQWGLTDPGVAIKRHPLCSAAQAAIEATLALRATHSIAADDVASVECRGTPLVTSCLTYRGPATIPQAQFSMPFAIACALVFGEVGLAQLRDDVLRSPAITRLMARVALREDPALVAPGDRRDAPEASAVTIHLRDGNKVSKIVLAATGMPTRPLTHEQVSAKFLDCARFGGVDETRATMLASLLRSPAGIAHTRRIAELAAPEPLAA
ncbi:MAG: MmgE/PrpD family protein [Burkholderiales bacterium]|nr:MmgE/PrpD family protein [Burkholderiales bacterium]